MAVPKRKTSISRTKQRRAHDALKPGNVVTCPNCGAFHKPHRVCPECGQYKGRTVGPNRNK